MKKHSFLTKTAAIVSSALLAVPFIIPGTHATAATKIASFPSSKAYRWVWNLCDSYQEIKSNGFASRKYTNDISKIGGDYALVITDYNKQNYFANKAQDNKDDWTGSGAISDSDWFDVSGKPFITRDRHSSILCEFNGERTDISVREAAFDFRLYFDTDGYFSYNQSNGSIVRNTSKSIYGFRNDGNVDWRVEKNSVGEAWRVYYENAGSNFPSDRGSYSNFWGHSGSVHIFESDNTDYIWRLQSNNTQIDEKSSDSVGELSCLYLWMGHFTEIPGLPSGLYTVPSGQSLGTDSPVTLITGNSTLTVEENAVLYVSGALYVEGNIENYGTIIVEDGGTLILGDEGSFGHIDNFGNGSVFVAKGGEVNLESNSISYSTYNAGSVIVASRFNCTNANFTSAGTVRFIGAPVDIHFTDSAVHLLKKSIVYTTFSDTSAASVIPALFGSGSSAPLLLENECTIKQLTGALWGKV